MKFNLKGIGQAIGRKASMAGFKIKVHSPAILVGAGIVGLVTAGILACKATPKALKVTERCKYEIGAVKKALTEEMVDNDTGKTYSEQDAKKDTRTIYLQTAGRYIKCYGPSAILATLSIISILGGFKILNGRYLATASVLAGLEDKFAKYREHVAGEIGKEREDLLFKNAKKKLITEPEVNTETGEVTEQTKDRPVAKDIDLDDKYCFLFDIANAPHTYNAAPGYNYAFLIMKQNEANERLKIKGYVTLDQILESLGMQPVDYGMVAGWVDSDPGAYIDFGITHRDMAGFADDPGCWSGGSPDYMLLFNCRGNIQAGMPKKSQRRKTMKESFRQMATA